MTLSTNNYSSLMQDEEPRVWGKEEDILVPCGYSLRAAPAPLISANDGRWIARVVDVESGSEGILIYEDRHAIVFLTADEVVTQLAYFIREAWNLIPEVDTTLSETHAQMIEHMRSMWWIEETRKARAVVNASLDQQKAVQI